MATEDLTTFTEVDEDADITVTTTKADVSTIRNDANSSVYKSYGSGHFGNFEHYFEFYVSSGADANSYVNSWHISNTAAATDTNLKTANVGYASGHNAGSLCYLYGYADDSQDIAVGISADTLYYVTVERRTAPSNAFDFKIYSDASKAILVDTISVTYSSTTYEYLGPVGSLENLWEEDHTQSYYVQDLDINEASGSTESISTGTLTLTGASIYANLQSQIVSGSNTLTGNVILINFLNAISGGSSTLTGQSIWGNLTSKITSGALTLAGQTLSYLGATVKSIVGGALTLVGKDFWGNIVSKITKATPSLSGNNLFGNILSKIVSGALTITGGVLVLVGQIIEQIVGGALTLSGKALNNSVNVIVGIGSITLSGATFVVRLLQKITSGALTIVGDTLSFIKQINIQGGILTLTGKTFTIFGVARTALRRFFDFF